MCGVRFVRQYQYLHQLRKQKLIQIPILAILAGLVLGSEEFQEVSEAMVIQGMGIRDMDTLVDLEADMATVAGAVIDTHISIHQLLCSLAEFQFRVNEISFFVN